ncbi:MAG: alpha/beta fold hydrolase [Chloroflexi bacterium]|nr:alpha/beta fold hydrolase [Chloroflexota bacterium]
MDAPQIQYVRTTDGVSIAYYSMGRGIPFVATSELQWAHLNHTLSFREFHRSRTGGGVGRGMQVVRYDARGTGLSDKSAVDFSLEAQTRDLEAVLEAVGLDRFVLFGRTLGSPFAIAYAALHSERVSQLVLANPHARTRDLRPAFESVGMQIHDEMTYAQWESYARVVASHAVGFSRSDAAEQVGKYYRDSMTPASFRAFLAWRDIVDVTDLLPLIRVPTLVLSRRSDVRPQLELEVAAAIDKSILVSNEALDPSGRWLDAETQAIEEFLGIRHIAADEAGRSIEGNTSVSLTTRETEVLALLVAGQSNREIAATLVLSERTVARHIANIYEKTGAHGRAEITAYALRHRLA